MCICIYIYTIYITFIYLFIYYKCPVYEACFLQTKDLVFWNCFIALLLRLAAQQCTKPQTSTYGGHEWEEDVRCHCGVPESTNVWVCILLSGTTLGATWKNPHRASRCKWQQTPIQAHSVPFACWAGFCLLCCQPEFSLNRHLPDYQESCHDRLSEWKLKGDELST